MITQLKNSRRLPLSLLLAGMSIFCLSLSLSRLYLTDTKTYLFLNWNLFLAFIPWLASTALMISPALRQKKLLLLMLLGIWILFFPNSPYILTDLFHLRSQHRAPIWFDLVLIVSFAWTGLMYGLVSLMDIEHLLDKLIHPKLKTLTIMTLLFLGSFGVYLGRFLRWNSWDILQNPAGLFADIGERLIDPLAHPRTWGITLLFGLLLNGIYWSIKLLRERIPENRVNALPV